MLMSLGESTAVKEGRAKVKALLTLAWLNMAKTEDLGAVETALKNATEASLGKNMIGKSCAECLWAMAESRGLVSSPDDALDAADEAMDLFLELRDT
eukprot:Skav233926  [mRNA]  locus=scaffold3520:5225:6635:- [translate_table: standard]